MDSQPVSFELLDGAAARTALGRHAFWIGLSIVVPS